MYHGEGLNMISKELSTTLSFAVREAKKRRHEYVCVEHVLYAILHDKHGVSIIENCGGDIESIKNTVELFFEEKLESIDKKKEIKLLTGVTGTMVPGEVTALIGASGAGKTTFSDFIRMKLNGKTKKYMEI